MIRVEKNTQKSKTDLADKVLAYLALYAEYIGLSSWDLVIHFKKLSGEGVVGECGAEPHYYRAVIVFDLVKIETLEHPDNKIKEIVRHELLHCLVWRLSSVATHLAPDEHSNFITDFEENLTSDLERMPIWDLLNERTTEEGQTEVSEDSSVNRGGSEERVGGSGSGE